MKLKERLQKLKEVSISIKEPTSATINVDSNELFININGIPNLISFYYSGNVGIIGDLDPMLFRIRYENNKIVIINLFGSPIQKKLLTFNGEFNVKSCDIMPYSGKTFKASIERDISNMNLNTKKTKLEDDTEILRESYVRAATSALPPSRVGYLGGYINPTINSNSINQQGKYQQLEILDENQIASQVPSEVEAKPTSKRQVKKYRTTKKKVSSPKTKPRNRARKRSKY